MASIIFVCVLAVVLSAILFFVLNNSLTPKKRAIKLPSGKNVPSRKTLAKMNANALVKEYSKADLKWLRDYVLRQIPNVPLGYRNISWHMVWLDISRELDIALYGWIRK